MVRRREFDPDALPHHTADAWWAMLGWLQHHGPARAATLAARITSMSDVSDNWARHLLAWAATDEWLIRTPDGSSFLYDIHPSMATRHTTTKDTAA